VPQPGGSWRPQGHPATRPHEYIRGGTCKVLTLFHPATGQVHLQPVSSCTNPILHGWLKERLGVILAALPAPAAPPDAAAPRAAWEAWQDGLAERFTLPAELPPLRMLLVWDNLAGHKTAEMVVWPCRDRRLVSADRRGLEPATHALPVERQAPAEATEATRRRTRTRRLGRSHAEAALAARPQLTRMAQSEASDPLVH
jgi:hypothetical protein